MADRPARPIDPGKQAPPSNPIQPLPDLWRFADQLKARLADLPAGTGDPAGRNALLDQVDRFVSSNGGDLHRILADRQQRSGGRHLAELYRHQHVAARGTIPLDPISQAPGAIYRMPANLCRAPLEIRTAILIHAATSLWLEQRAGCDHIADRPFDCPTSACPLFGLVRQIDDPVDVLARKPEPTHVALVHHDRLGFLRVVSDAGDTIDAPTLAAAIARFMDRHACFPSSHLLVCTALPKAEAITLRRAIDRSPSQAETMRRAQEALFVTTIDDGPPADTPLPSLLLRTQLGNGRNRWFGLLNLVVFSTAHFGFVVDTVRPDRLLLSGSASP